MKVAVLGVVRPGHRVRALDPELISEHLALLGDGATARASETGSGQPFNVMLALYQAG